MPDRLWGAEADTIDRKANISHKYVASIVIWRFFVSTTFLFAFVAAVVIFYNSWVSITTRDALLDCIEPGGVCATENQIELSKLVNRLLEESDLDELATRRVVVAAEACGDRPEIAAISDYEKRLSAIQACVDAQLHKDNR